ncbi:MAG TPA: hypothetical protein VFA77_02105 [Candidatus Eisenbacteria bacterium]|nr:hypothetical protein [Candidatus Eisenbacteria bacterium]
MPVLSHVCLAFCEFGLDEGKVWGKGVLKKIQKHLARFPDFDKFAARSIRRLEKNRRRESGKRSVKRSLTVEAVLAKSNAAFEKLTQLPSQRETTGTGLFFPLLQTATG